MKQHFLRVLSFFLLFCLICTFAYADTFNKNNASSLLNFSVHQIDTMYLSTYMNRGQALLDGQWYYGPLLSSDNYAKLGKFKTNNNHEKTLLLTTYYRAEFITVHKGWIYYLYYEPKIKNSAIFKMRISGSDKQLVVSPKEKYSIDYMFIYDDNIYYTENRLTTGSFIRIDLNGNNKKTILNKQISYPYIIDDKLFYLDNNNLLRLNIYDLNNGQDQVLVNDIVYMYCIDNNCIVYQSAENSKTVIKRYDLLTKNRKTLINENTYGLALWENVIYYCNEEDNGRLYSYNLKYDSIDVLSQEKYVSILGLSYGVLFCTNYTNKEWEYWDDLFYISLDDYKKVSYKNIK